MYLRTPKRYRSGNKRSIISLRWFWLWLLTPVVVFIGIQIYNNREMIGPPVHEAIYSVLDSVQDNVATAMAPTPLPTPDPAEQLGRAQKDWTEGRIESAMAAYSSVLPAVPNEVEPYYLSTLGLIMEGQFAEAMDMAEQTVTANPFSSDAWAIRAMALDRQSRYGEAISSALRAIELDPDSARATAFLAEAYADMGENQLAQDTIEKALDLDPNSFEALRVRGLIAQNIEFDLETAKGFYQQAYDRAPNLPYLALDLANIYYSEQNYDEAIRIVTEITESNPKNSEALYQLGIYYYGGVGNFSQAADFLTRCVEVNPGSINCNAQLGRVQSRMDNNTAAVESLQRAIDLGSVRPRHYLWMGLAKIALGDCPGAVTYLQQAYELAQGGVDDEALTLTTEKLGECQAPIPGVITAPEATPEVDPSTTEGA